MMFLLISFVINYINNNYKIFKWVKLNVKKKIIDFYLNKLVGKYDVCYSVDKFDLKNN